ncbi:hypothetical protein EVAR_8952_1 [Eumeta japonica]|uniref:Uncharacterized protein n=1 Tax=Eumeta variegata TaxID=151549 RepID=A0A4C1U0L9_EUMVA|nr:hypothetical protein EVAR_8952_1 [Eumeta japonica]
MHSMSTKIKVHKLNNSLFRISMRIYKYEYKYKRYVTCCCGSAAGGKGARGHGRNGSLRIDAPATDGRRRRCAGNNGAIGEAPQTSGETAAANSLRKHRGLRRLHRP